MHRPATKTALIRARWNVLWIAKYGLILPLLVVASAPNVASAESWLEASATTRGSVITVTLRNASGNYLHSLEPNRWGLNNFVKVGTEVRPLSSARAATFGSFARPDLDGAMSAVAWARIDLGPDGLAPGAAAVLDIPRPLSLRGHVDLVVLARKRGSDWITLRESVATQVLVPVDGWRALACLALVLGSLGLSRRPRQATFAWRAVALHSTSALLAAALAIWHLDGLHYREFPHSDGVNYAVIARAVAEGRGLVSPIIQPGLVTLARTEEQQQAFLVQAPGWPLVLAQAFRLAGPSARVEAITGYGFVALAALGSFWLAALFTQSAWAGYLAMALDLSGPWGFGAAVGGRNTPLQSVLIVALFLLLFRRSTPATMALAGLISGLGLVVRETTLFAVTAFLIAVWWRDRDRAPLTSQWRAGLAFLVFLMGPWMADRERRSEVSAGAPFPTVTATLLYGTSQMDNRWYWREPVDWASLHPLSYLAAHPDALRIKVQTQIVQVFLRDTLPTLISFSPLLLPLIWPFAAIRERRAPAAAIVLSLLFLVIGGSVAFLHPSYFYAWVPALAGLVAATADGFLRRVADASRAGKALFFTLATYALVPLPVNLEAISKAGALNLGEYPFSPPAVQHLCEFVAREIPSGSLTAVAHNPAPLLAWYVRRNFLQYDPGADTRIGPTPMWARILDRTPVDYILITSLMDKGDEPVPPGFSLRATLSKSGIKAWLYGRSNLGP